MRASRSKPQGQLLSVRCRATQGDVESLPKLVAFDLDATLWWPELNPANAPYRFDTDGRVVNRHGGKSDLLGASGVILQRLVTDPTWSNTQVAYVSRSEYAEFGVPCMKVIPIADGVSMYDVAHHHHIYGGTKDNHFRAIRDATGIAFEDMIFFENEQQNIDDVLPLGITCVYTPEGMTEAYWEEGLRRFAEAAAARATAGNTTEQAAQPERVSASAGRR